MNFTRDLLWPPSDTPAGSCHMELSRGSRVGLIPTHVYSSGDKRLGVRQPR